MKLLQDVHAKFESELSYLFCSNRPSGNSGLLHITILASAAAHAEQSRERARASLSNSALN